MKVIFLNHNQENFGTYYRCLRLAEALVKLGITVTLVCASGSKFDLIVRKKNINGVTLITLPRITYHKYFTGQILRMFITIFIVTFYQYDILHAFTLAQVQIAVPAIIAKVLLHRFVVMDWDDLWGGGFGNYHAKFLDKLFYFFERKSLYFANHITYASHYLGKLIYSLNSHYHATYLPNGIEQLLLQETSSTSIDSQILKPRTKIIVSVGNTYFTEGLRILFNSILELSKQFEKFCVVMVGFTDIPKELEDLYRQIQSYLIITGHISKKRVSFFVSKAHLLVLPMDSNLIEIARFPVRLNEYILSGKPIVSNAHGEVKKVLTKYKCGIISSDSPVHMAQLMYDVLHYPQKYLYLKTGIMVAQKELAWSTLAKKVKSIYDSAI